MKQKEVNEKSRQMSIPVRVGAIFTAIGLLAGGAYGAYFFVIRKNTEPEGMGKGPEGMNASGVVTATGTTTVGMSEERFDVDSLETSLKIEDVYLNSGDEVEQGAKILKISEESLEEARTELEQAAKAAEYAYRLGVVDHEEALITAKSTYDEAAVNSNYADNDYQSEIQEKAKKVTELEEQVAEAQEIVDEYTASQNEDAYYSYYKIDELKEELYENFTLLMQLYDEWGIEELSKNSSQNTQGSQNDKYTLYQDFDKEVQEEQEEYDTAMENYEDAKRKAETNLDKEKANLEKLKAQLSEARVAYDEAAATAGSTKRETVAKSGIAEDTYKNKYCVLGNDVAKEVFGSAYDAYDETVYIDDRSYTVKGVISEVGTVASGISPDTAIFVPYETGIKYLTGNDISPTITVIADDTGEVSTIKSNIETVLSENYTNASFAISDAGSKMEAANQSNRTLTLLLYAMAAIVFVVGGIGIMNVLFVSVKERTNEIGILKAIGCSQRDILLEFLLEASTISLLGSIIGVICAVGITPIIESFNMTVSLSVGGAILSMVFGVFTGTVFGFYPAYKASTLVPVVALNQE
ncbi:ABC transporter permease [Butyrivibrio sp. XPD2002]|uniref:ABC transporter permease n=1 Tax=Butyrivibrio sp. XPD2002 TaxID=1280665 RepID=UPI000426FC9C|nr:ABC transporter permease [Butyrivibrio sp. XPD2002]